MLPSSSQPQVAAELCINAIVLPTSSHLQATAELAANFTLFTSMSLSRSTTYLQAELLMQQTTPSVKTAACGSIRQRAYLSESSSRGLSYRSDVARATQQQKRGSRWNAESNEALAAAWQPSLKQMGAKYSLALRVDFAEHLVLPHHLQALMNLQASSVQQHGGSGDGSCCAVCY